MWFVVYLSFVISDFPMYTSKCMLVDVAAIAVGEEHSLQLDTLIPRPTGDLLSSVVKWIGLS